LVLITALLPNLTNFGGESWCGWAQIHDGSADDRSLPGIDNLIPPASPSTILSRLSPIADGTLLHPRPHHPLCRQVRSRMGRYSIPVPIIRCAGRSDRGSDAILYIPLFHFQVLPRPNPLFRSAILAGGLGLDFHYRCGYIEHRKVR